MAEPRPNGSATSAAIAVTTSVPETSGRTPKCAGSKSGDQFVPLRKSTIEIDWKNSKAGTNSAITIPTVVATEMSAQRARTPLTTSSPSRRRLARSWTPAPAVSSGVDKLRTRLLDRRVEIGLRLRQLLVGQRHELRRRGDLLLVLEREAEERLDLGPRERVLP